MIESEVLTFEMAAYFLWGHHLDLVSGVISDMDLTLLFATGRHHITYCTALGLLDRYGQEPTVAGFERAIKDHYYEQCNQRHQPAPSAPRRTPMKPVTVDEYAAAITRLLPVARHDTGQSGRVAAVLLSIYNSDNFHVPLAELGCLDEDLYQDCITVIRGRIDVNLDPWRLIENGQKVFERLVDLWTGLRVEERAKVQCHRCDGRGRICSYSDDDDEGTVCTYCNGTGRVCSCRQ
ncbi:MAG: hypothetical protein WA003_14745 [Desulfuromonadaceae bacterium]